MAELGNQNQPLDTRDRGQHVYYRAKDKCDTGRQEVLRQKNRDREAKETADQQGQERTVERPPNLRQNAEFFFRYVPVRGCQKPEVIFVDRRQCLATDLPQDVGDQ